MIGNEVDTSVTYNKTKIIPGIHNLLSNAIKFSHPDSTITIVFSYTTIKDRTGQDKNLINKQPAIRVMSKMKELLSQQTNWKPFLISSHKAVRPIQVQVG